MSIGLGLGYMNSGIDHFGFYSDRSLYLRLKTSIVPDVGSSTPTFTRATKAWGFNELGYLEELPSGCAFFGGARLVRNLAPRSEVINAGWTLSGLTASDANTLLESAGGTVHQCATPIITLGTYLLESWMKRGAGSTRHVRLEVSSTDTARVNFNLDTGEVSSIVQSGSLSLISYGADADVDAGGYRRFYIRVNASASVSNTFYAARLTEGLNGPISYSGDGTSSILISKVKISDVTNYDASYVPEYVSVGVEASPYFGAGIDGAKYFETDWQGASIAAANLLGFRIEASAINNLLYSRDLSNAAWSTKTNITAAKTATGLDGIANTATTLTATAADATILQPISLTSAARCASAYVKRRAGSGTISFTQDGGSTWTDITAQINSSTWSRVQITATLSNPSTGFKISTSGDAIDVDCVQNEAGTFATSPIVTTTAAITRNASALSYATAFDVAQGTALCSLQSDVPISTSAVVALAGDANARMLRFATDTERDSGEAWDATNTATATGLSVATGIRKRACRWGSDLRMSADGTLGTAESFDGGMGASTTLFVGCNQASAEQISGTISEVIIWPTALTDAQLQQVTR